MNVGCVCDVYVYVGGVHVYVMYVCMYECRVCVEWQPTPVFLPGEFHGQRSLAGYSPWGHKESDMTE